MFLLNDNRSRQLPTSCKQPKYTNAQNKAIAEKLNAFSYTDVHQEGAQRAHGDTGGKYQPH